MGRLLVVIIVLVAVAFMVYLAFPPGSPYALDKMLLAWQNPADQSLGATTVNAMYELQSNVILVLLIAVPAGLGGLVALAFGSNQKR